MDCQDLHRCSALSKNLQLWRFQIPKRSHHYAKRISTRFSAYTNIFSAICFCQIKLKSKNKKKSSLARQHK